MSYRLLSNSSGSDHDAIQWNERSLDGELEAFNGRTLIKFFNKYLIPRNLKVVEAGCGLGAWCEWLARCGHDVIGIEYDERIVQKARSTGLKPPIKCADIAQLPYPDNSFDAYISLGVIEHFEQGPEHALAESLRVLKPGGIGFFTTPLLNPFRRFITHPIRTLYFLKQKIFGKDVFFWEYRFTRNELRNYLIKAGFEIIDEGVDDYNSSMPDRHLGLWADWFFLRKKNGNIWELNSSGKILLSILRTLPESWYCAGYLFVVKSKKQSSDIC